MANFSDEEIRRLLSEDKGITDAERKRKLAELDQDPALLERFNELSLESLLPDDLLERDLDFEAAVAEPVDPKAEESLKEELKESEHSHVWSVSDEDSDQLTAVARDGGQAAVTAMRCNVKRNQYWQKIDLSPLTVCRSGSSAFQISGVPPGCNVRVMRLWKRPAERRRPVEYRLDGPRAPMYAGFDHDDQQLQAANSRGQARAIRAENHRLRLFKEQLGNDHDDFECELKGNALHVSARIPEGRRSDMITVDLKYRNRSGEALMQSLLRVEPQRGKPDWSSPRALPIPALQDAIGEMVRLRVRSFGPSDMHLLEDESEFESLFGWQSMVPIAVRGAQFELKNESQVTAASCGFRWALSVLD